MVDFWIGFFFFFFFFPPFQDKLYNDKIEIFRLDSHIAAWVWSYFFVHMVHSQYGTNFTEMNYGRIETLIAISWACVWLRFFHVAMTKGELI